jgi:hypothetical protein
MAMYEFPKPKYRVDIEVYDFPNKDNWVQARFLVHSFDDVMWTDSVGEAVTFLEYSLINEEGLNLK